MDGCRRSRGVARALALGGAIVLALAACSSSPPDLLQAAGGNLSPSVDHLAGGVSLPAGRGVPQSLQLDIYVCAVKAAVVVDSVALHDPTPGLVLRKWGVDRRPSARGDTVGPLSRLGDYSSHTVRTRCSHDSQFDRVGVELVRTSSGSARTTGFDVHYRSGGTRKTLWLAEFIALCTAKDDKRSQASSEPGSQDNLCGMP